MTIQAQVKRNVFLHALHALGGPLSKFCHPYLQLLLSYRGAISLNQSSFPKFGVFAKILVMYIIINFCQSETFFKSIHFDKKTNTFIKI